jgi:hypothetical protein
MIMKRIGIISTFKLRPGRGAMKFLMQQQNEQ